MEDSTTYTHLDEIIDKYDNFICDVDGVLFNGTVMIDGTPEGLQYLRDNNKKFYFVSNSSARTRKYMVEKFKKMGITIFENEAFSSGYTTSVYLRLQHPEIKKVYVIGERGLMEQLEAFDNGSGEFLKTIGGPEETETTMTHTENENYELDPEVGAVV